MKVLVTGGTGFLGRAIVRELAPRHALRLLVRPRASRERFPEGVEFAPGDVVDRPSLGEAMRGSDALVHAAALVKIMAPAAEFDRINLGGLDNVLGAAREAGLSRCLYVSSFIALGPTERGPGGVLDDDAPPADRVWINDYERTKTIADRAARAAIAAGAPLGVVYPGVIYGPGEFTEGKIVVRPNIDLKHRRLPALVGKPERRWNYAFVEDVARGVAAALERGPDGGRYVLGGEIVTLAEFYRQVGVAGGFAPPGRRMPDSLAALAGAAMKLGARLTGGVPKLTPDLVEIYRHDWAYSSARAESQLGYRPRTLAEGLRETMAWLQKTSEWPR
jgi:farnesol dehydrogenase